MFLEHLIELETKTTVCSKKCVDSLRSDSKGKRIKGKVLI